MASEDGFSDLDWSCYNEENLAEIERLHTNRAVPEETERRRAPPPPQSPGSKLSGPPKIDIALEQPADDSLSLSLFKPAGDDADDRRDRVEKKSLYNLFRKSGDWLSVTDCVGPAWCEVQYDYGLRQKRSKPLISRPTSFKTEQGKEIVVKQKTAEKREQVVTAGTAVHKVLEKEQKLLEFKPHVQTAEEMWALRLLDFLTRLTIMEETSYCREISVWGVVQDQLIFGCIDELRLAPDSSNKIKLPTASPSKKSKKSEPDPKQRTLPGMMSASTSTSTSTSTPAPAPAPAPALSIQIIDTKTRGAPLLPAHADTLPSRLQLMLYRRLLVGILAYAADPAPLLDVLERARCDIGRAFSDAFRADVALMVACNNLGGAGAGFERARCLLDMVEPMQESVGRLVGTRAVAESLHLVYRSRGGPGPKGRESKSGNSPLAASTEPTSRKRKHDELEHLTTTHRTTPAPAPATAAVETDTPTPLHPPPPQERDPQLIGTKKFKYNSKILDAHMQRILEWWYGRRPSEGVSVENTHRCRSCEYRDGCEWREAKAREWALKQTHKP